MPGRPSKKTENYNEYGMEIKEKQPTVTIDTAEFEKLVNHKKQASKLLEKQAAIIENLYKDIESYEELTKQMLKYLRAHARDEKNVYNAVKYRFPMLLKDVIEDDNNYE